MMAWFVGVTILLLSSVGSGTADQLIDLLVMGILSVIATFAVGFPLALLATRVVSKFDYKPSPIFGTLVGILAAVSVLIVVALPFYGAESVAIVFQFFFSPIVAAFAAIGGVTGLLVSLEIRGTTTRSRSESKSLSWFR